MIREKVKQEIDKLTEDQLKQVERFIASIKLQNGKPQASLKAWDAVAQEE